MHYAYVDGKKVSNHLMRDCMTFLRLQEAMGLKQTDAQLPIAHGAPPPPPLPIYGKAATQGQFTTSIQGNGGYTQSRSHMTAMIQPVPKEKKNSATYLDK
jgi:hypothetical protein